MRNKHRGAFCQSKRKFSLMILGIMFFALLFPLLAKPLPAEAADGSFRVEWYGADNPTTPIDTSKEPLKLFQHYTVILSYTKPGPLPASVCPAPVKNAYPNSDCPNLAPNFDWFEFNADKNIQMTIGMGSCGSSSVCNLNPMVIGQYWERRAEIVFLTEEGVQYYDPDIAIYSTYKKDANGNTSYHAGKSSDRQDNSVRGIWFQSPYFNLADILHLYVDGGLYIQPVFVKNEDQTRDTTGGTLTFRDTVHNRLLKTISISFPPVKLAKTTPPPGKTILNFSDSFSISDKSLYTGLGSSITEPTTGGGGTTGWGGLSNQTVTPYINNGSVSTAGNENGLLKLLQTIRSGSVGSKTSPMDVPNLFLSILTQAINLVIYALPVFALIMIMYAGIQYIFSAGNPTKSGNAVKLLNSAIIGFAAFLMLLSLWVFMTSFIGINAPIP